MVGRVGHVTLQCHLMASGTLSLIGVCFIIEPTSGLVIDYEVLQLLTRW